MSSVPPLNVHEVHRPPAPLLRYVDQVTGDGPSDVEFRFSRSVLTDFDVDVVHVLETNLDALLGTRHAGPVQRILAVRAFTSNLRKYGIALVRTLPDARADDRAHLGAWFARRMLDKATTTFVVFHESTPTPDPLRTVVIPHAQYRERFRGYPRGEKVEGRMLCVARGELPAAARGLIGIPRAATSDITVRFAGEADEQLEQAIRSTSARYPSRVSARLERLSDGARVQEIDAAELVAVPEVRTINDLQTVFLALTLGRPVIVPRSLHMASLAEEVGPGWLHLTDNAITAASVDEAFSLIRKHQLESLPDLGSRGLSVVKEKYATVFHRAAVKRERY